MRFETLEALRPKGLKALGSMAVVRNSVGADSYACDEKLTARFGRTGRAERICAWQVVMSSGRGSGS